MCEHPTYQRGGGSVNADKVRGPGGRRWLFLGTVGRLRSSSVRDRQSVAENASRLPVTCACATNVRVNAYSPRAGLIRNAERTRYHMAQTPSGIPVAAVRGVATGVLFMAFFGTLWAGIGIGGLRGWGGLWVPLAAVLVGIGLLIAGIFLFRSSRGAPNPIAAPDTQHDRRTWIWFGITFATEGLLIAVASVVCNALNRVDLFFPIMAIIVGVHFFPLAALFQVMPYYLVGALMCGLALITLLVVPESATLGGQPILAQSVVLGFGAALILWVVGFGLWLLGRRLLAGSAPTLAHIN